MTDLKIAEPTLAKLASDSPVVKEKVFSSGKTVVGVKFKDYLDWISKDASSTAFEEELKLPSIQRGFVWKPAKIVTLWDSLLRGMPFGSLLLSNTKVGDMVRDPDVKATPTLKAIGDGQNALGLLDGQQRTLAMKIGWPGKHQIGADHCLWIDLSEDGHKGAPFEMRITTTNQPFGYARHTHVRMSIGDRRDAAKEEKNETKPWKGVKGYTHLLIPLHDLWRHYLGAKVKTGNCFHSLLAIKEVVDTPGHPQREALIRRLDRLAKRFEHLVTSEIPLVLLTGLDVQKQVPSDNGITLGDPPEDASNDPLILLFQRISTAGERLSFEDLLFSMIKRDWPQAHDLVEKLHSGSMKHLLTAPGYVMAAFRLASIEHRLSPNVLDKKKFSDIPEPGDSTFYSRLSHLLGSEKTPGPLRVYVSESSPLVHAFDFLYELLVFNTQTNPNGIPKLMMPLLPPHLIHVLVYWVMQQGQKVTLTSLKPSSEQLIAFVLFWHLCVIDGARASQEALAHLASDPASRQFPGAELYGALVKPEKDSDRAAPMRMLYLPNEINSIFDFSNKGELRSMADRICKTTETTIADPRFQLFHIFWKKHTALLWIQRDYMSSKKFIEFNALAGKLDAETVPYDYDHICPQAEWREIRSGMKLVELWMRDLTGNSIGNFHLLHASDNRGLGDASTSQKLVALEAIDPDFFSKSAIDPSDRCLWKAASPFPSDPVVLNEKYTWTPLRIGAFQEAVDKRVMYLYSRYFDGVKCLLPPYQQSTNSSVSVIPLAPSVDAFQSTQTDEAPVGSM
jgi:hypothetical protein